MTQLPGIAGEIEVIIGLERTVRLLKARGGTEIIIPKKPGRSILCDIIGADAVAQLIRDLGTGKIDLPCAAMRGADADIARRKANAIRMLGMGRSLTQTALDCDLSVRTVKRYRREMLAEETEQRQGKLFL